jgi:DNA-directed RNA polymerase subunit RPC12/RpoP
MRCPNCHNKVLQKSGSQTKLRTQGPLIFENGVCFASCYWCKAKVEIPLQIQEGTEIRDERFVLRNHKS